MLEFSPTQAMPTAPKKAKLRSPRNRTIDVIDGEAAALKKRLLFDDVKVDLASVRNKIICGDAFAALGRLSASGFDLLFADPPYNLTKAFGKETFSERTSRIRGLARIVAVALRAAFKADGVRLYLRRLALKLGNTACRVEIFQAAKSHHLGT